MQHVGKGAIYNGGLRLSIEVTIVQADLCLGGKTLALVHFLGVIGCNLRAHNYVLECPSANLKAWR